MDIVAEVKRAVSLTEQKKYKEAEKIYKNILSVDNDNPLILSFLGVLYLNICNFKKAEKYLLKADKIKTNPVNIEALAKVYFGLAEFDKACTYFEKAILNNKKVDMYEKYIYALTEIKSYLKVYEIALEYYQTYPLRKEALASLLYACIYTGRLFDAQKYAEQLVSKYPKYGVGWIRFGLINEMLYQDDDFAYECFKKAVACGEKEDGYYNLAVNCLKKNDFKKAKYYINKLDRISNGRIFTSFLLSTYYFRQRQFKKGYKYYVAKDVQTSNKMIRKLKRIWDGKKYKDETLLIYADQGIGDQVMFSRYIPALTKKFKKIKVLTVKPLMTIFKRSFKQYNNIEFIERKSECLPRYDKSAVLSNLPYYLKSDIDDIPFKDGYMIPSEKKIKEYKEKYFNTDKIKVGICWEAGAAGWREQINRTLNINFFDEILNMSNVQCYSLLVNPSNDNYKKYTNMIDLGTIFKDFDDTAAALKNLDYIVTVDTSVAHLGGALGCKVFMLLPYCPDWRWFDCEKDTDWYNSVKIFKQENKSSWDEPISDIKNELKK